MSAHVLLNLLNELRKRDKMQSLPSILFFFFATSLINSIMLDSMYHMTLNLFLNHIFGKKCKGFAICVTF